MLAVMGEERTPTLALKYVGSGRKSSHFLRGLQTTEEVSRSSRSRERALKKRWDV